MMDVFVKLKNLRIENGISMEELSEIAAVGLEEVERFESGDFKTVDRQFLVLVNAYAKTLGMDDKLLVEEIKNTCSVNVFGRYVKIGFAKCPTPSFWLAVVSLLVTFVLTSVDKFWITEKKSEIELKNF